MLLPLEHAQIQVYTTCTPATFRIVLHRYWRALKQSGCSDDRVREWLMAISWPRDEEDSFGDIFAAPVELTPAGQPLLTCAGIEVSLYTRPGIPTIEEPPVWLGFNLLLNLEELRTAATDVYKDGVGGAVWVVLRELSTAFEGVGAYFTDPWQENTAWRAIVENDGDPWAFELAIFPRALAGHFQEVPPGYQGTVLEGAFGFAPANRWKVLPWQEAEQAGQKDG